MVFGDGVNESGWHWAESAGVQELEEVTLGAACCTEAIGPHWGGGRLLLCGSRDEWHEPEPGDGVAVSLENFLLILEYGAFLALEEYLAALIAEFTHRE